MVCGQKKTDTMLNSPQRPKVHTGTKKDLGPTGKEQFQPETYFSQTLGGTLFKK